MLSVPFAVSELGVALAALVLPAVAAVVVFTLKVLLRAADIYGAVSYQELVREALGPAAAHAVSVALIAYIAGSCVATPSSSPTRSTPSPPPRAFPARRSTPVCSGRNARR